MTKYQDSECGFARKCANRNWFSGRWDFKGEEDCCLNDQCPMNDYDCYKKKELELNPLEVIANISKELKK